MGSGRLGLFVLLLVIGTATVEALGGERARDLPKGEGGREVEAVAFQKAAPTLCLESSNAQGVFCRRGGGQCPLQGGTCCGGAPYCCPQGYRCRQLKSNCLVCLPPRRHMRPLLPLLEQAQQGDCQVPSNRFGPSPTPLTRTPCGSKGASQSTQMKITQCQGFESCPSGLVKRDSEDDTPCTVQPAGSKPAPGSPKACAAVCCKPDPAARTTTCASFWKGEGDAVAFGSDIGCPKRVSEVIKTQKHAKCVRQECPKQCCAETLTQNFQVAIHFRKGADNYQIFSFPHSQWDHKDNGGASGNPGRFAAEHSVFPKRWMDFRSGIKRLAAVGFPMLEKNTTAFFVVGHCPTNGDEKENMKATRQRVLASACYLYTYLEHHGHKRWSMQLGYIKDEDEWGQGAKQDAKSRRVDILMPSNALVTQVKRFVKDESKPGSAAGMKRHYNADEGDLQQTCGNWWKASTWKDTWLKQ